METKGKVGGGSSAPSSIRTNGVKCQKGTTNKKQNTRQMQKGKEEPASTCWWVGWVGNSKCHPVLQRKEKFCKGGVCPGTGGGVCVSNKSWVGESCHACRLSVCPGRENRQEEACPCPTMKCLHPPQQKSQIRNLGITGGGGMGGGKACSKRLFPSSHQPSLAQPHSPSPSPAGKNALSAPGPGGSLPNGLSNQAACMGTHVVGEREGATEGQCLQPMEGKSH